MDAGTGFCSQVYELSAVFLHKVTFGMFRFSHFDLTFGMVSRWHSLLFFVLLLQDWIMEQWEKNYYISSIAGAANGSSLVVMSKGWLITCFFHASIPKKPDTSVGRGWVLCGNHYAFQNDVLLCIKTQVSNRRHFDVQCGVITTPTGHPKPVFCKGAMACRHVGDTL